MNYGFNEKDFYDNFLILVSIDSTTSLCKRIEEEVMNISTSMGFSNYRTHKGGVIADLGGDGNPLVITSHLDDIGLMVRHINSDGTLKVCTIGGLYPAYSVGENVRIYTRDGNVFTGVIIRKPNSIHVSEDEIRKSSGDFAKDVAVLLDLDVKSASDVREYGIEVGDVIALEPRTEITNGYIKSRFIDDKASVAIMINAMKAIKEEGIKLKRKVYFYFSAYEEIGHGTSYLPDGVKDILAIDIAPMGEEQTSNEKKVSIFAKDSRFPYHYEFTKELVDVAKKEGVDYVIDVFTPHYGSDGDTSVVAGHDVRHACIGFGTMNSHGYERTHIEGIKQTYSLLMAYLLK